MTVNRPKNIVPSPILLGCIGVLMVVVVVLLAELFSSRFPNLLLHLLEACLVVGSFGTLFLLLYKAYGRAEHTNAPEAPTAGAVMPAPLFPDFEGPYKAVLQNTADPVITVDDKHHITFANAACERTFGYTVSELMGKDVFMLLAPDERGQKLDKIYTYFRTGIKTLDWNAIQAVCLHKNGKEFPVEISLNDYNTSGRVMYTCVFRDITERKREEEILKESENRFRKIIECSTDAYLLCDARGVIYYASPSVKPLLGLEPHAIDGRNISELCHPDEYTHFKTLQAEISSQPGKAIHEQFRYRHARGQWRWMEVTMTNQLNEHDVNAVVYNLRDTTELHDANEQVNQFLDISQDIFCTLSFEGNFIRVNPAFEYILGYVPEEVIGRHFTEFLISDDIKTALYIFQHLKNSISGVRTEWRWLTKTGKQKSLEWTATPLHNDKIIYALARDITLTKEAEDFIRKSEERYRAAAENSFDAFFILRSIFDRNEDLVDFEFTDINHNAEKLFRRKRDELLGHTWLECIQGQETKHFFQEFRQVMLSGQPLEKEHYLGMPDGRMLWLHYQVIILSDGIAVNIRDISTRKRAEEQIKETSEKYQLLFECNPLPMWVVDIVSLKFMAVNESAINCYGYSWDEFMHMTIDDIIPQEDGHLSRSYQNHLIGNSGAGVWRHVKKDGSIIYVEITSNPLFFEGKQARLVLAHDVTEKKKAERDLHESEAKLVSLLENTNECIWSIDLNGNILTTNTAFEAVAEELLGMRPRVGASLLNGLPKDRVESFRKTILDRALKGERFTVEREYLHNNKMRYFDIHVNPIMNNNAISGISFFTYEVTGRKELENAIRDIATSLSAATGGEFFRTLASYLSTTLQADYTFIGKVDKQSLKIDTIAFCRFGLISEFFKVTLNDPVCLALLDRKEMISHTSNAGSYYSDSALINGLNVSGLIGVPLINAYGEELGILLVMNQKPVANPELAENILRISAIRTAAELERLRTEEVILQSEANMTAVLENADELVWSVNTEHHLTVFNSAFRAFFARLGGVQVEQDMYLPEFIPAAYKKDWLSLFSRAMAGESFFLERSYIINDTSLDYEVHVSPIKRNNGVLSGVSFFARDITEKNRAARLVRDSEQRYRNLIENMTEGVMYTNPEGRVEFANEQFFSMLGYSPEELAGKDINQIILTEEGRQLISYKIELRKMGVSDAFEIQLIKKSGEQMWVNIQGTPLIDDNGENIGSMSTITDITERKLHEEKILKSEAKYRSLVETMNEGMLYVDQEGIIRFVNPRLCLMLGYTPDELQGYTAEEALKSETLKEVFTKFASGESLIEEKIETKLQHKNGRNIWVLINTSLQCNENNEFTGLLATFTEITDLKNVEEKLKVTNQDLNTFVYKSSHDLKGPLSSIMGLTELGQKEVQDATARLYLDMIRQGAGRLDKILSDLLDTVKIKEGIVSISEINFQEMLDEIMSSMEHCNNFDRLKFTLNIHQQEKFFSDRKIITSVLQNLVDNAIKYQDLSKPQSFVTISIHNEDNGAKIEIEDNGLGIMKSAQDKIFDMFYRANLSSKGTGLGLYIVKHAIEKLGGSIHLISSEGVGSRFVIFIPNAVTNPEPVLN